MLALLSLFSFSLQRRFYSSSSILRCVAKDDHFMQLAMKQAQLAYRNREIPVGAIIVDENNTVIATAHNTVEGSKDATMHAELECIRKASLVKSDWRLSKCTIFSTLQPCEMCAGAIKNARIKRVVFSAYSNDGDKQVFPEFEKFNFTELKGKTEFESDGVSFVGGVHESESLQMLKRFFQNRRENVNEIPKLIN